MLAAFISLGILGLLLGALLAYSSLKFHVETDPRIEALEKILPGSNCGGCGKAGCSGYAAELVNNSETPVDLCAPGGAAVAAAIAQLLEKDFKNKKIKKIAFVFCQGGKLAKDKFIYSGRAECRAAVLVAGGQKACTYGCLGFGDCVRACKFAAIFLTEQGIPLVNVDKCVNCGACAKACPKNLIKEVVFKESRDVVCASLDNPKIAKANCSVACIGCGICVKNCPYQAIVLNNNLAFIDREKCTNCGICATKCPTKAIK